MCMSQRGKTLVAWGCCITDNTVIGWSLEPAVLWAGSPHYLTKGRLV